MAVDTTYKRGWERAFAKVDAAAALDRARLAAALDRTRPTDDELLTFDEAGGRLKVTNRTVRNLIKRGELTRVELPSTNLAPRVAAADVAALIARGREAR